MTDTKPAERQLGPGASILTACFGMGLPLLGFLVARMITANVAGIAFGLAAGTVLVGVAAAVVRLMAVDGRPWLQRPAAELAFCVALCGAVTLLAQGAILIDLQPLPPSLEE